MEISQMRQTLKEKLSKSNWDGVLAEFIDSASFELLMTKLKQENDNGGITPPLNLVFNSFYTCPYPELKVVVIGQDPYPKDGVADGIAFSCSQTMKVQPSLRVMFKEIEETVDADYDHNPDLTRWSGQGVLLLNTALTTTPGKIGCHYDIWKPFIHHLLMQLEKRNNGLIYVFMGAAAKEWSKMISETNYKLYCYHPASAMYSGGKWDSNDVFNRINDILEGNNGLKIKW